MKKIILLGLLVVIVAVFFHFDLERFLTLEYIKAQQQVIDDYYAENRALTLIGFFLLYVVITGASLPGAAVLTLAGGAIFGLVTALILISFASTIGATLAFLVSRFLLRDWVQGKFGDKLGAINEGIKKDGAFYLFSLRLVPIFPFFIVNLVPAFLGVSLKVFFIATLVGIIPGSFVYATVGAGLGSIFDSGEEFSPAGILTPEIVTALVGLAILALIPVVYKRFKARRS